MKDIKILPATTPDDLKTLCSLADEIWHEHYQTILTAEQIDYMVEKYQSLHAVTDQVNHQGYQYFLLEFEGEPVGYFGVVPEKSKMFLSKIYVRRNARGHGAATAVLNYLEEWCRKESMNAIWLTVNKYNSNSIAVYQKFGFQTVRDQVTDIGNGFVMDDYIMEKVIF